MDEIDDRHFRYEDPISRIRRHLENVQDPGGREDQKVHQDEEGVGCLAGHLVIVRTLLAREHQEVEHQAKEHEGDEGRRYQQEVHVSADVPAERRIVDAVAVQDIGAISNWRV